MSEQPTAAAAPQSGGQKGKPPGKTYLGLTRNQLYITGGVFVAVLAYILWKRHQASTAAAAAAPTNQGSNECTDANGNPVDCNQAFASELASMQNALDQLGAQGAGAAGSSGGGGYYGGPGTTGTDNGTGATSTTTTQPPATPVTSTGATSGGTKTAPRTAGAITGLKASNVTKTSFTASWNAASNAQEYAFIVRDLASHTQASSGQTSNTSVTVSGLKSGVDYNFGIQALPGGTGNNIHVRTT